MKDKTVRLSISGSLATLTAVLFLIVGVYNGLYPPATPSLVPWWAALLLAGGLVEYTIYRRTPKFDPKATGWKRFLPASLWGLLPSGALLGLLVSGLAPLIVTGDSFTSTGVGTSLYTDEVVGLIFGILAGIIFAWVVDARLAAGLLFGYGIGFPTGMLVTNPDLHHLWWTYGGHLGIFGVLGLLHLWLKPLLDRTKK